MATFNGPSRTYDSSAVDSDGMGSGASKEESDAFVALKAQLEAYGLGSLTKFVYDAVIDGDSEAEILRDIQKTPEYAARFPAIIARQKAGLAALSPAEYIAYERQGAQLMRAAGLPKGFYDGADDFTEYLTGDVSLAELSQRIELGRDAAYKADPAVISALREYGLGDGDITAYFLDPDRAQPLLERQWQAAQIGGAGKRSGFGMPTQAEADQLVGQGVSAEQAQQGFGQLAEAKELFGQLPGEASDVISRDEQIGAVFSNNAEAKRRIEAKKNRRLAEFEGGGGVFDSQEGATGLADTSRR